MKFFVNAIPKSSNSFLSPRIKGELEEQLVFEWSLHPNALEDKEMTLVSMKGA